MPRPRLRRTPLRAALAALALAVVGLTPTAALTGAGAAPGGSGRRPRRRPRPRQPRGRLRPLHADRRDPGQGRRDPAAAGRRRDVGRQRWSLLFRPGTYGTAAAAAADQGRLLHRGGRPGRLARPTRSSTARSRSTTAASTDGPTQPYCVALNNFWRSLSNLTIQVNGTGQDGCRGLGQLLGHLAGLVAAPRRHPRRQPVADGLLHRRPAVRQRRLPRRLPRRLRHQRLAAAVDHPQLRGRRLDQRRVEPGLRRHRSAPRPRPASPTPPYTTLDTHPAQPREAVPLRRRRRQLAGPGARRPDRLARHRPGPTAPPRVATCRSRRSTSPTRAQSAQRAGHARSTAARTCCSPPACTTSTAAWWSAATTPWCWAWARRR